MNQQTAPGQDDDEIQDLAMLVAKNLADGESPDTIVNQLVDSGWETDDANSFVASIQHQLAQMQSHQGDGEGMGWLLWIGGILLINLLSYLFNWGFWIY